MFNLSPKWNFPSNNHSQIIGIADSGVEMFKGTPIKSLAREICQNSLDARLDNAHPARLEFETFTINPKTIPDSSNLEDAFERSRDFWKIQDSTQARNFFKRALKDMNANTIKCLRISDFNTSGLTGSRDEYNSPWCNLTKSSGASNKSGSNGGSFGIGKFAPFACSSLRTVFYSTYDVDNISASQGVARLTTFKNKKKETTQGIGFYGCDKNSPMYNQYSLNPNYTRPEKCTGTDIFIAGFTGETGWEHQMVASILDGFLYAIYTGSLVVDVDGITINKEISAARIRNVLRDKATGQYTIVFTPMISAQNGIMDVFMSAESQNYEASIVSATCVSCPDLKVSNNRISNLVFTANQPLRIDIQLDYHDYCSMEVKAYGNQV